MKTLINKAIFKEQMKRFWLLSVFYFLFLFIYGIVPLLNNNVDRVGYAIRHILDIVNFYSGLVLLSILGAATIAIIFTFYYLFDKRATVAIHSYPITKKQLYITNISVGLILFFIPFTLFCLLLAVKPIYADINNLYNYGMSYDYINIIIKNITDKNITSPILINSSSTIFEFFVKGSVLFLFYYFMILLSAVISGNIIIFIVNAFILAMAIPAITAIYGDMYLSYNIGIGYYSLNNIQNSITGYTVPLVNLSEPIHILKTLVYVLLSLLFAFIAYKAYVGRNEEKAGRAYTFVNIQNGFILFGSSGFSYLVRYVMMRIEPSIIMGYASLVLGFIIGYMAINMLIERDFNIFFKFKKFPLYALAFSAIFAVLLGSVKLDVLGLTKLPNSDEIEGIYVDVYNPYDEDNDIYLITSPDVIDMAISLEEEIGLNKKELIKYKQQVDYSAYSFNEQTKSRYISLTYKLKDGTNLNKNYTIPLAGDIVSNNLSRKTLDLLENKDVLISKNPIFKILIEDIAFMNVGTSERSYKITDTEKIKEAIDIIEKSLVEDKIAEHNDYVNSIEERKDTHDTYLRFEITPTNDDLIKNRNTKIRSYGYPVSPGSQLENWIKDNILN